jgi:hypothetical protein
MRLHLAATMAVAGLVLAGCGVATAGVDHQKGNGGHPVGSRVTGKLEREGGPIGPGGKQPPVVPLSGTVVFSRRGHPDVRVHAGRSGIFSALLAPGRYSVSGRVHGLPVCRMSGGLKVTAGNARHIVVACIVP